MNPEQFHLMANTISIKYTSILGEVIYCYMHRKRDINYAPGVLANVVYDSIYASGEVIANIIGVVYERRTHNAELQTVFEQMEKMAEMIVSEGCILEIWIMSDDKDSVEVRIPTNFHLDNLRVKGSEPNIYLKADSTAYDRRHHDV